MMMTEAEFWAKVEYEGGIDAAVEYGLRSTDCEPGGLRDAWAAYVEIQSSEPLRSAYWRVRNELDRVGEGMNW